VVAQQDHNWYQSLLLLLLLLLLLMTWRLQRLLLP